MRQLPAYLLATALAAPAACGDAARPAASGTEDPSEAEPLQAWTLAREPEFSVTESDSPPAYHLFNVGSGLILADGDIVVGNRGTFHLIFFDSTGQARAVAGGRGEGPGELRGVGPVFEAGDAVGVWDPNLRRASYFSRTGEYLYAVTPPVEVMARPRGYLPGAGVVIWTPGRLDERSSILTFAYGEPRPYQIWSDGGELAGELLGPEQPPPANVSYEAPTSAFAAYGGLPAGWPVDARPMGVSFGRVPGGCAAEIFDFVLDSALITVDTREGVVTAYSSTGAAREIHRAPTRTHVSAETHEQVRTYVTRFRPPMPEDTIASLILQVGDIGDPLPAWAGALPDPSGRIWLQRPRWRCDETPADRPAQVTYDVIDLAGARVATITLPTALTIVAVRGDRLLAIRRDDLDVEHLELSRVVEAPAAEP